MPSYNLTEIVHNRWLQQLENHGKDLYIATIDDFVRAFMQMVRYYQYLKENQAGTRPRKEDLLLWVAQQSVERTRNPKALMKAILNNPRVKELVNREPHFKGDEVLTFDRKKERQTYHLVASMIHWDWIKSISSIPTSKQDLGEPQQVYKI